MGFIEVLTLILIVFKLLGLITCSWWIVLSPLLCVVAVLLILSIAENIALTKKRRDIKKRWYD